MKNKKIKEFLLFALFVFPAVIFVLFATDIPFLMNLYYSVFDWNGVGKEMTFVGLDNFVKIFTNDSLFWKGVKFTLKFAVFYVIIVNIISLIVALVMSKEKKTSSVGRAFYYIPYIISLTAISLIWKFIFGPGFEAHLHSNCLISSWYLQKVVLQTLQSPLPIIFIRKHLSTASMVLQQQNHWYLLYLY